MQGPNFLETKFFGDGISWGPKKSGDKISLGPNVVSHFEVNPLVLLAIKFRLMFSCENAFDSRLRKRKQC